MVDEAIYAIQPETVQPILKAFYGTIYSKVSTDTSLTYYFSGQAGKRAMELAAVRPHKSLAQLKPERLVQPKVRKAFPDTAYWIADVDTDSGGQATVKFNYPDAITSWRATTRGVTQDTKVGSAVENTIVRKNVMVRLVVPRFFRRGDEIVLSTIVQNYLADREDRASLDGVHRPASARWRDQRRSGSKPRSGEGRLSRARARCGFGEGAGQGAHRRRERCDGAHAAGRAVWREAGGFEFGIDCQQRMATRRSRWSSRRASSRTLAS